MRKRKTFIIISILFFAAVFMGSVQASGDNNTYNNGEEGNYEDNNENQWPDDEFPGEPDQKRGGVVWP